MKKIIVKIANIFPILLIFVLWLSSCSKQPQYADSYVIQKDGLFGLIDSLGNEIISPKYLYIEPIQKDGVALAVIDTMYSMTPDSSLFGLRNIPVLNIKYGYVNKDEKFIFSKPSFVKIPIYGQFDSICAFPTFCDNFSFYGGLAIAQDTTTYRYGYIGLNGDTIIPAKYHQARVFNQGRAAVQLDYDGSSKQSGKWGLINPQDQPICDFVFSQLTTPFNGRAIAEIFSIEKQRKEIIEGEISKDTDGKIILDKSKSYTTEADGSPVFTNKIFLVDENGKVVKEGLNMMYQYSNFSKDGIAVAIPNKIGNYLGCGYRFINKDGEFIKPLEINDLTGEQIQEIMESKFFIDDILPVDIEFKDATRFSSGYAAVKIEDFWIFVDSQLLIRGNKETPIYEDALPFSYGLAGVKLNGKYGYIDKTFNISIPCKYDSCAIAGRNLCRVYSGERKQNGFSIVSYINKKNEVVWQNIDYEGNFFEKPKGKPNGVWKEGFPYVYIGKDYTIVWILLTLFIVTGISYWIVKRNKNKKRDMAKSYAKNIETASLIIESQKSDSSNQVLTRANADTNPPYDISVDKKIKKEEKRTIDERLNDILGF